MAQDALMSLKEVSEFLGKVSHRIIHLCEVELIKPAVDASGRGKFRQFSRDNVVMIDLALNLQEAGLQAKQIAPLMTALGTLMKLKSVRELARGQRDFDLAELIRHLGAREPGKGRAPVAWISLPKGDVTFITPNFKPGPADPKTLLSFAASPEDLVWTGPGVVVNLASAASNFWLLDQAEAIERQKRE
jgi:hypothetical protein